MTQRLIGSALRDCCFPPAVRESCRRTVHYCRMPMTLAEDWQCVKDKDLFFFAILNE